MRTSPDMQIRNRYSEQGVSRMETTRGYSPPAIKRINGRVARTQQGAARQGPQSRSGATSSRASAASAVKFSFWSAAGGDAAGKMLRVIVDRPSAGTFFAGSEVTGCVQIDTKEDKKFKYIHISLTGRAQVGWVDSSNLREYRAEKEYLHKTQMLWTREDHGLALFPAGLHNFPFRFTLPQNIPSSFEGRVGSVRYELFGRIVTGIIKTEHSVKIDVPVIEIIDVNKQPLLTTPTNLHVQRRVWNFPCSFGTVSMAVCLKRTGFCVGEDVQLNISLENGSCYEVFITASLGQKITYMAKRKKRQFDKATVVRVTSRRFAGRTSTIWPTNLRVPFEEATSQDYELVNIGYRVKIVATAAWGQTLVAKIPITIGNIPYGESLVDMSLWNSRDNLCECADDHSTTTSPADDKNHHQLQVKMMSSLPHSDSQ